MLSAKNGEGRVIARIIKMEVGGSGTSEVNRDKVREAEGLQGR